MNHDVTKQKKLWIYAVILFACAFIVILATGYSQIKIKNSLNNAQSKASNAVKKSISAEQNLSSANKKIDSLKEQLETATTNSVAISKQLEKYKASLTSYEALVKAENADNNGNYINCALILKTDCDSKFLEADALKTYNALANKTFEKASVSLYYNGYEYYVNREYKKSIDSFKKSLIIIKNAYYSDDCYYFIAYSQYALGKYDDAKATVKSLMKSYPSTNFLPDAKNLLKLLNSN